MTKRRGYQQWLPSLLRLPRICRWLWLCNLVLAMLLGCTKTPDRNPNAMDPFISAPLHTSYSISVTFSDSSLTRATLKAGSAIVDEVHMQTALGGGVYVVFYNRTTGAPSAWLKADSASIDDRTKDMTAIGNVRVQSDSSHTTLDTPQLVWMQKEERIRTSEAVRITTPTEVIDGVGLVSDQFLTDYKIFKVRGIHQP